MINKIVINNFKSIVDMTLDLGRVNVIIGANGCGKTNILEAISFASAASQDKLDNEFLLNRGIRVTEPQFMTSAFEDTKQETDIPWEIRIEIYENEKLTTDVSAVYVENSWTNFTSALYNFTAKDFLTSLSVENQKKIMKELESLPIDSRIGDIIENRDVPFIKENFPTLLNAFKNTNEKTSLAAFLTYAPVENVLRKGSFETSILPLGRNGEGLLAYLKNLSTKEDGKEIFNGINAGLTMLDWFEGLNIPDNLMSNEYGLNIGDRFLKESLHYFDQRSTNEGFLFLLFYLTLFNSKQTPSFFAVDNIETSFNPKLCTKLIQYLVESAKKKEKQVILTTHSPYVLDGLDLSDDEQRLFVARRDIEGHTRIERIPYRADRDMLLSDLWMSGLIGGLPDNF